MNSLAILVAAASLGVDYGWRHLPDGQLEYLIQIEPGLFRSMENGVEVYSELLPEVRGVRRFRISVGNKKLPREAVVQASAQTPNRAEEKSSAKRSPLGNPRLGDPPWDPRSEYANQANPIRPGPEERQQPSRDEPDRMDANAGRPIEQAAAKPTGSGSGVESPSSEMSRLVGDGEKADAAAASSDETSTSPWLVGTIVALCASLGANFYQGWNLKSARRRYYQLVDRLGLRPMPGSDGVSIEGYAK